MNDCWRCIFNSIDGPTQLRLAFTNKYFHSFLKPDELDNLMSRYDWRCIHFIIERENEEYLNENPDNLVYRQGSKGYCIHQSRLGCVMYNVDFSKCVLTFAYELKGFYWKK